MERNLSSPHCPVDDFTKDAQLARTTFRKASLIYRQLHDPFFTITLFHPFNHSHDNR
ncbi:hypothetical protein GCM10009765_84680 [Fodinicola feengrottensis]|uniref:Uncharacterized protein n=1 Tax=Fodinicola feengrottensis TaxID=435914 RepID=A0ABP4VHJ4_9ACTN